MTDIILMNKEELRDYAKSTFGISLDMRKGIDKLQEEVKTMKPVAVKKAEPVVVNHKYLKNTKTGFWFPYTDLLNQRGDLVPCDEAGNELT